MSARLALFVPVKPPQTCSPQWRRCRSFGNLLRKHREFGLRQRTGLMAASRESERNDPAADLDQVLFVEAGFGADQHGQDVTKAVLRACRNAIEFNSIPSVERLVPGGRQGLRLKVKVGCPRPEEVDVEKVQQCFPYGQVQVEVVEGGLSCNSGIQIEELGDRSDEMVIAVVAVVVGYGYASADQCMSSLCAAATETSS